MSDKQKSELLLAALAKSQQYIEQLCSMVNTLKPKGVYVEDFTEPARNAMRAVNAETPP